MTQHKQRKGIILAGGKATRLYPITKRVSKQLLPVYDKPMIYYPLSVLMLAGIRNILVISTSQALPLFEDLFTDGRDLGINIQYARQEEPKGIAESFIIGEKFLGQSNVALILGDNLFFGNGFVDLLKTADSDPFATVFAYYVKDPGRYGVVEFDGQKNVVSIEEKPKNPKSNYAVTGLYFYNQDIVSITKSLKPSLRGELEITDVNMEYLSRRQLKVALLGRGYAWLDTGTHDSLLNASSFVRALEDHQGLKVGCIEEVAYRMGFIDQQQLLRLADGIKTPYSDYLRVLAEE